MTNKDRKGILSVIDTKTKVLALVTLVIEATFIGSIAALPTDRVFWALVVCATIFAIVVVGVIVLEFQEIRGKKSSTSDLVPSPLTPDSPLLNKIITGAVQTVCRGVTVPKTPEEAELRAFIFKKQGSALVCTHFWAPESLKVKEEVGLTFQLDRSLADKIAVVKAYFDEAPARARIEPIPKGTKGIKGTVNERLQCVLAVPIRNEPPDNSIWGVVDFDTTTEIGKALLTTTISDNVMYHLAEHLRLLFSLSEIRRERSA